MYHVVIISENRILLKNIYEMIEDNSQLRIHIVPFSMDAYEEFYENHADIVILDTSVFLPYEKILEQFYQCQWQFHALLISEILLDRIDTKTNIFYMEKGNLSKELFFEIFSDIQKHSSIVQKENTNISFFLEGEHTISIHPDTYHLLLIKNFDGTLDENSYLYKKAILNASIYCELHPVPFSKATVLFYISRSQINKDFSFDNLSNVFFQTFGPKVGILYEKNISWKNLQSSMSKLSEYVNFLYFSQGESKDLLEVKKITLPYTIKDLKNFCYLLLQNLLENNLVDAKHILQDLYFHTIKRHYSFEMREYIRIQLQFIFTLFELKASSYNYQCVEDELAALLASDLFIPLDFPSVRIGEILTQTVLAVYKNYDTNISLEGIAMELNLNKIYLNRIFKNQFNMTVFEALQICRLQYAKYSLIYTEKKVADIALESGFSDSGYFSKFFRKSTGYSALEFRALFVTI